MCRRRRRVCAANYCSCTVGKFFGPWNMQADGSRARREKAAAASSLQARYLPTHPMQPPQTTTKTYLPRVRVCCHFVQFLYTKKHTVAPSSPFSYATDSVDKKEWTCFSLSLLHRATTVDVFVVLRPKSLRNCLPLARHPASFSTPHGRQLPRLLS